MDQAKLKIIIETQFNFFASHRTRNVTFRIEALKKLKNALINFEKELMQALWADLHKSNFESYSHELGQVLKEIDFHLRHLKRWSKPQKVASPLAILPSRSRIYHEPYGNVLIISPWNYPILLLIDPLIGAISAGNTVVLKPSPYLKEYSRVIELMMNKTFPKKYIAVATGGREVNQLLLKHRWDYIFFTGSPALGKVVMKAAAEFLTPLTLELGGKSPCIVDEDANLKLAARRIVWGKFINGGQTCIAPDYLFVHEKIKDELLRLMKIELVLFYGEKPEESPDFCRIVNKAAFERLLEYLKEGNIVVGGNYNENELFIAPTIIDHVESDFAIMQEEIFGPVLPVMTFSELQRALDYVDYCEKPLAFYYFTNNLVKARKVIDQTTSGGGCINDTILHIANFRLPFGGVGNSGMGKYHGKLSFDTFSNQRSMVFSSRWLDIPLKYPPYGNKLKWIKKIL
ncbi:MAG: aldehyde dehydrogenase [Prolixibacteraceae bacterium]